MDIGNRVLPPSGPDELPAAARGRSIGALLVDGGKLSPADAEAVLRHAREKGLRFGDAAVKLGLVTSADVQHALARQFDYPYLAQSDGSLGRELIAAFAPFSSPVEALRALRTQLVLRWFDAEPPRKTLAIVSAKRRDGRSYVAANLAVVFSQLGEKTLLVDADLRNPRLHAIFGLSDRVGLSALLSGRGSAEAIVRIPNLAGLSVLPAGATPPNPLELLARTAFPMLLQELSVRYDVILIDTPAVALGADYQSVSAAAGGALLVARRDVTRSADAQAISAVVAQTGAAVVGALLNEH
jgi:protein-tyrosine kinase